MTGTRIEPTPEDLVIFSRSTRRILNWSLVEGSKAKREGRAPLSVIEYCQINRRAVLDMMHFGPESA